MSRRSRRAIRQSKDNSCRGAVSRRRVTAVKTRWRSWIPRPRPREDDGMPFIDLTTSHPVPYLNPKPISAMPPPGAMLVSEWRMVVVPPAAELDQCPPDHHEWCFFKKSYATGLSTCRGRKLLDAGEVVHFAFPSYDRLHSGLRMSVRQAVALVEIMSFSTNRSGEVHSSNYTHSLIHQCRFSISVFIIRLIDG